MLNSPLQQSGLTLAVQAAPFKGKSKEASVALAIEVDGGRLHFEPAKGSFHDDLVLSFFALDDKGKPHQGTFYNLNLTLRPELYERIRTQGLRMNPRVGLPSGRYQMRIGVRESGAGEPRLGIHDLDVPDFTAADLAMSGLLLTAGSAKLLPTVEADATVAAALLPGPATSRREFVRG